MKNSHTDITILINEELAKTDIGKQMLINEQLYRLHKESKEEKKTIKFKAFVKPQNEKQND